MGKMLNCLLIVVAINFAMTLFLGAPIPGSSLYNLATSPENWGNLDLYQFIEEAALSIGLAGILIGTLWTKSDFLIYASFTAVFLSFGMALGEFYQIINAIPQLSGNIAKLMVSPLVVLYFYTALKFWKGAD